MGEHRAPLAFATLVVVCAASGPVWASPLEDEYFSDPEPATPTRTNKHRSERDLMDEESTMGALIGLGYGSLGDTPNTRATQAYYLDTRVHLDRGFGGAMGFLFTTRARFGSTDVGGFIEDGEALMGVRVRLGRLDVGLATGLGVALQAAKEEPDLGASLRVPLALSARTAFGRTMIVAQAMVGRATGDRWQDGSDAAPTGDYLSADLTLWSPPVRRDFGVAVTVRYDEFGGARMWSVAAGLGKAVGMGD